ncbi:hypothetical protein Slu03_07820 [Sediminihabitans luteus]|uniref:hypothetical protein n=1 Tax=Sediminihabitans luteus TaxID=1138585 RepID=UPI000C24C3D1|nr:hypothetical protein [Sediminihabitans luteus]GII98404.1 hypothetical protein Slu03_07820 [Sediminihabitans luteus]
MSAEFDEETPEEHRKRVHGELFVPGGPDVAICGLSVARATITQRFDVEGEAEFDDSEPVQWQIYGGPTGAQVPPYLLFGDLIVTSEGWFAGTTVVAIVEFRDVDFATHEPEKAAAAIEWLGPWATHVLYDAAAASVRRLAASSPEADLEVPYLTPQARISNGREA